MSSLSFKIKVLSAGAPVAIRPSYVWETLTLFG